MTRTTLPAASAAVLLFFCGLVHGLWTDRWALTNEPGASAARLQEVAAELGGWRGEPIDVDPSRVGPVAGHLFRRYQNEGGQSVTMALVCGRPGPVSVHTPDACYTAKGYAITSQSRFAFPPGAARPTAEFWTADLLKKKTTGQTRLRIFWAWSADGTWQTPADPRLTFAHHPALDKLYLIRELNSPGEPLDDDPCVALMHALLPELQRALFPGS